LEARTAERVELFDGGSGGGDHGEGIEIATVDGLTDLDVPPEIVDSLSHGLPETTTTSTPIVLETKDPEVSRVVDHGLDPQDAPLVVELEFGGDGDDDPIPGNRRGAPYPIGTPNQGYAVPRNPTQAPPPTPAPIVLPPPVIIAPPHTPPPGAPGGPAGEKIDPRNGWSDAGASSRLTRNAGFLFDFLLGTGRTYRDYEAGDPQMLDMIGSPGANHMRDLFRIRGCQSIPRISYSTLRAAHDTILNRSTADLFSTAFQVGGFIGSVKNNGDGSAAYTIRNEAGRNSFWFHVATNIQASPSGAPTPMRSIYQTFKWTEEASFAGCR
jgi:hypothetical protein